MSTAEQWAGVLGSQKGGSFILRFDRLGLEAQCRPLQAGEVEECVRMGGERGLRYALYLACDDLREAGESLKKQGTVASAFDITEKLSYGDVLAAGAAILSRSGADSARVRLDGQSQAMPVPQSQLQGGTESLLPRGSTAEVLPEAGVEGLLPGAAQSVYPVGGPWLPDGELLRQNGWVTAGQIAQDFADRLWAAAGNR